MFFALASLGLPGLGNFVAEFLILLGVWPVSQPAAVLGAVGLVVATVYALWMMQRVFQGRGDADSWSFADLTRREVGVLGRHDRRGWCCSASGPQPLITTASQTVVGLQQMTRRARWRSRSRRLTTGRPRPPAMPARPQARPIATAAGAAASPAPSRTTERGSDERRRPRSPSRRSSR